MGLSERILSLTKAMIAVILQGLHKFYMVFRGFWQRILGGLWEFCRGFRGFTVFVGFVGFIDISGSHGL